jgi:ABC-type multidrug transport system ATPase subunit
LRDPLQVQNLSKRYGRGPLIIDGLTRTFRPGTVTGLVGPNGAGKSTLLRLLSVLSYPTEGRVTYGDIDVHREPYRYLLRAGIVHESAALPEYLSASELVEYVHRARGTWNGEAASHRAELFDRILLDERRENLLGTYSSGMVRKTQIVLALATRPDILLMDEPFRGLDRDSVEAALDLLIEFKSRGGLVLVSGHERETLHRICDDFLLIGQAR